MTFFMKVQSFSIWRRCILRCVFFHPWIPLGSYSFSSRAQWYPSHWACQSDKLQLWLCKGNSRFFCLLLSSHQRINPLTPPEWPLPVGKQWNLFPEVWWHKSRERRGEILHCNQGDGGVAWSVSHWWFYIINFSIHDCAFFFFFFFYTGYKPYEVTHASDHFQKLYDLAVDLIRRWI